MKSPTSTIIRRVLPMLLLASPVWAQKISAGLWQATSQIKVNGIPLPSSKDEECISKKIAGDLRNKIAAELKDKGCMIKKWDLKKNNLQARLKCDKDDLKAEGELKGTVTQKSYHLSGEASGSFKSIPSVASFDLKGEWRGTCKK